MHNPYYNTGPQGALATLRSAIPDRRLSFSEALRVAELQAARLLELFDATDAPVHDEMVLALPHIKRRFHQLKAASGMTYWNGHAWVIGINSSEPLTRQRFTLLHEFKHIIDHGRTATLYPGDRRHTADRQAELAADYFAGCVLVPKRLLKRAWYQGTQYAPDLAKLFDVSVRAIEVRLQQVGLVDERLTTEQRPGAATVRMPERPANWYFRLSSYVPTPTEAAPCLI